MNPNQKKIIAYDFSDETNECILHIADGTNSQVTKHTVSEISANQHILKQFSPIDAFRIGYFQGICAKINDEQLIKKK